MMICPICDAHMTREDMRYQLYTADFKGGVKVPCVLGACKECEDLLEKTEEALNTIQHLFMNTSRLVDSEPPIAFAILNDSQMMVIRQFAESQYHEISEQIVEATAMYTKVLFTQMHQGKNFQQAHDIAALSFSAATSV